MTDKNDLLKQVIDAIPAKEMCEYILSDKSTALKNEVGDILLRHLIMGTITLPDTVKSQILMSPKFDLNAFLRKQQTPVNRGGSLPGVKDRVRSAGSPSIVSDGCSGGRGLSRGC